MKEVSVKRSGSIIMIGDMPQLIVDLKSQQNYIKMQDGKIPYKREVTFSEDLLAGKRKAVFDTAVKHYYRQACEVAEGIKIAEAYRPTMNTATREVK